jgi:hypothetical protein
MTCVILANIGYKDCIVFDIAVGFIVDNQYARGQKPYRYLGHLKKNSKIQKYVLDSKKYLDVATI